MNPQQTLTPQPQAGAQIQPQATTVSPQGVASQVPVQAPTPPVLPQGQAPAAIPSAAPAVNYNTSQQLNNIADYYQIPRQTAQAVNQTNTAANVASANFEAQKAQNEIKIQNQQNALDPSKYQFTKNADGSVSILNSVGDKVDIGTYAALTGANPATALQQAGATDQASENFIAAYNNLQTFAQDKIAAANGDVQAQGAIEDFYKANPGLATGGPNGQPMELGQLQQAFMQQYGQYFGQPSQPSQSSQLGSAANVNPTLTSQNNPVTGSAYENPNYQADFTANQYQPQGNGYGTTGTGGSTASELAQLEAQAAGTS
jgi:hypothetical protein